MILRSCMRDSVRVRGLALAVVMLTPCVVCAYPLTAQMPPYPGRPTPGVPQPAPQPAPQAAATPSSLGAQYRIPVIAIVQPAPGTPVAQDRPIVVLRYGQGEPSDPLDVRSFSLVVDGVDRTDLFQVTLSEAWGPLTPMGADRQAAELALGAHQVTARICSVRGACGSVTAAITVAAPPTAAGATAEKSPNRRKRLLDAILAAGRKLLVP